MSLQAMWYEKRWYQWLLWPLSLVFAAITMLRRYAYRRQILSQSKPNVPVIVVGNISVGGNGKTPTVIALVSYFEQQGYRPGILSRGYGGDCKTFPHQVTPNDLASYVGDEPCLMARRLGVPVVIDPVRSRGAHFLADSLQCNLIICDDGLQHYGLGRDIEVVVMDQRGIGNGLLLPAGPLREGPWRLAQVDVVIFNTPNGLASVDTGMTPNVVMQLEPGLFRRVTDPLDTQSADALRSQPFTAIAGIGYPQRFYNSLRELGLTPTHTIDFVDHHQYQAADIPLGTVLMTEKDAIKVKDFAHEDCWYLPVDARLPDMLFAQLTHLLNQQGYQP